MTLFEDVDFDLEKEENHVVLSKRERVVIERPPKGLGSKEKIFT